MGSVAYLRIIRPNSLQKVRKATDKNIIVNSGCLFSQEGNRYLTEEIYRLLLIIKQPENKRK